MISSPYLDTIICLILVYALLGTLVSILVEAWNQFIKQRGAFLQKSIFRLLDDPLNGNLGYLIYQHPTINRMRKDNNSYPYYISDEIFSNALIETIANSAKKIFYKEENGQYVKSFEIDPAAPLADRFTKGVKDMEESEMKVLYMNMISRNSAQGTLDIAALKKELSIWYNDYMDRVTGQYKTLNRPKMIGIGLLVAFVLNVDTINITKTFYENKELRDEVVNQAVEVAKVYNDAKTETLEKRYDNVFALLNDSNDKNDSLTNVMLNKLTKEIAQQKLLNEEQIARVNEVALIMQRWQIPLGYNCNDAPLSWMNKSRISINNAGITPSQNAIINYHEQRNAFSLWNLFKWLVGVCVTGVALGFGAPFWFQVLTKLINMRSAGVKPETQSEKK
jgi:hypothetical protein